MSKVLLPPLLSLLAAVLAAGCVTRIPRGQVAYRNDGLRPVALGPASRNFVEATAISVGVRVWSRSKETGQSSAVAGQEIKVRLYVTNVDKQPHTNVAWRLSESGVIIGAGEIPKLAPGQEAIVTTRYKIDPIKVLDLHFAGTVNPANTLKESADGLADNRVAARLAVAAR